jgi:hypothetical protein
MSLLNQKPLGVHENQTVIQARIEGLSPRQTIVEVRLIKLGIPDDLISAATGAVEDSHEYLAAENAIIAYLRGARMIEEFEALDLLNGREF